MEQVGASFQLLYEQLEEDIDNASYASPDRFNVEGQIALALTKPFSEIFTPEARTGGTSAPSVGYNAVHSNTLHGVTVGHVIEYPTPDASRMQTASNGTPLSPLVFTECTGPVESTMLPMDARSLWLTPDENKLIPSLHEWLILNSKSDLPDALKDALDLPDALKDALNLNSKYLIFTPTQEQVDLLNYTFNGSPPQGAIFESLFDALDGKITSSYITKLGRAQKAGTYQGCLHLVYSNRKAVVTNALQAALVTNKKDPSALGSGPGRFDRFKGKQGVIKGDIQFKKFQFAFNAVAKRCLNKLLNAQLGKKKRAGK